jgi:hypothetical protein
MPVRRGYRGFEALRPDGRGTWEVYISYDRLERMARKREWKFKELAVLVPDALRHPAAVFRGVRGEDHDAFVYVGLPAGKGAPPGGRALLSPGEVFVVLLTANRVVYNWRRLPADPTVLVLPLNHQKIFLERLR